MRWLSVFAVFGLFPATALAVDNDGDGYSISAGDCNDADSTVHPGATEAPNGVDDDCDGFIDEGTMLYDDDADGFTEVDGDCDDADSGVYPGATEIPADKFDSDCDGKETCFEDSDLDGYGSAVVIDSFDLDCLDAHESAVDTDCDDADSGVCPGATEIPGDGIDNDCDGVDGDLVDTGDTGATTDTDETDADDTDGVALVGCSALGGSGPSLAAALGFLPFALRRRKVTDALRIRFATSPNPYLHPLWPKRWSRPLSACGHNLESSLYEMMVARQHGFHPILAHEDEARAVRK